MDYCLLLLYHGKLTYFIFYKNMADLMTLRGIYMNVTDLWGGCAFAGFGCSIAFWFFLLLDIVN
jgi:hypothetical protein